MLLLYDPHITWVCSILGAASQFILTVPQNRKPYCLEKEMTTHSSTLAWKIPWTEELGARYCPWGRKESGTTQRKEKKKKRNPYCNRLDWGLLNHKNSSTDWSPREFEEYLRDYFKKAVSSWKLYFKCSDLWRKFCSLTL